MRKSINLAKRTLAVSVALLLILGTLFTGVISADAGVSLADGLTDVASKAKDVDATTSNANRTVTDISGGGVKLEYKKRSAYMPYRYTANLGAFPAGGIMLQFANYETTNTSTSSVGYRQLCIGIANSSASTKLAANVGHLRLDMVEGKLVLGGTGNSAGSPTVKETIITSDNLKYDAIKGKAFAISIYDFDETRYSVEVDIEGTLVSGYMTKSAFNEFTKHPTDTATYISIGSLDFAISAANAWSVEFYGYKAITPVVSDGPLVDTAGIVQIAKKTTDAGENSAYKKVENIKDGGILYTVSDKNGAISPYVHNVSIGSFPGTGVTFQFSNYKTAAEDKDAAARGYRQFMITLATDIGTGKADCYRLVADRAAILFDTNAGKLLLVKGKNANMSEHEVVATIAENNALKYANLTGKAFTLAIQNDYNGGIKFTVAIAGTKTTTVTGTVAASVYESIAGRPLGLTYAAISSVDAEGTAKLPMSIEYYGFASGTATLPDDAADLDTYASSQTNANPLTGVDYVTVSDYANGGIHYSASKYSAYQPYAYKTNVGGYSTGLKLCFANYVDNSLPTDNGHGQFLVMFGSGTNDDQFYKFKTNVIGIDIDTVNGRVLLVQSKSSGILEYDVLQTVITNDIFKYENFSGKAFTYILSKTPTGDIKLEIKVGETTASGEIDITKWNRIADTGIASRVCGESAAYISFGGIVNKEWNKCDVDFFGSSCGIIMPDLAQGLDEYASSETNTNSDIRDWWSTTNYKAGGVHYNVFQFAGYMPYMYSANVGGYKNGFKLVFGNFKDATYEKAVANQQGVSNWYGQFLLMLSRNNADDGSTKFKNNVVGIDIDTLNGQVKLVQSTSASMQSYVDLQTLITDDAFKYENFTGKTFSYEFNAIPDSQDIQLKMMVQGIAQPFIATIDINKWNNIADSDFGARVATDTTTFISFGGIYNDATSYCDVDFYGYKNNAVRTENVLVTGSKVEVIDAINALPDTASLEKADQILQAKSMYDALSKGDKAAVSNAEKLETLISELNELRMANKIKPYTTYEAVEPDFYTQFGNPYCRTVWSFPTDDGFDVEWRGGSSPPVASWLVNRSQAVYGTYGLDGLALFLNKYTFDAGTSDFWVHFTSGDYDDLWDNSQRIADREIAIHMGLSNGRLELDACGFTNSWRAGNTDILLRDNLKDKQIIIEWHKQENSDYVCSITVGQEVVAFTMSNTAIAKIPNFDPEAVRVLVGTQSSRLKFSMSVNGISAKFDEATNNVINAIDNLPNPVSTVNDCNAVDAVYTAYKALNYKQMNAVTNIKYLTERRYEARALRGVDADGKDAEGFYIPNTVVDVSGDVTKDSKYCWAEDCMTVNGNAGVHFDYNNGGYALSNYFEKSRVVDGFTFRFDNFNYSWDGGFFFALENCSQEGKIWDHTGEAAYDGFWFLVGRNNTVYVTYPTKNRVLYPIFEPNEHLASANLVNKEFTASFKERYVDVEGKGTEHYVDFTFTVDGIDFKYTFTDKYMTAAWSFNTEDVQAVVHAACGLHPLPFDINEPAYIDESYADYYNYAERAIAGGTNKMVGMSIDVTGIKFNLFSGTQQKEIDAVAEAIDGLEDNVTYDDEELVEKIWNAYMGLKSTPMRKAVPNFSKLLNAHDQLINLHLADGTLYTVEDEEDEDYEEYEEEYEYEYEDDDYGDWFGDYDDEEFDEEYEEDEEGESTPTKRKILRRRRIVNSDGDFIDWIAENALLVALCGVALLIIIGGTIAVIIILKKKKKDK